MHQELESKVDQSLVEENTVAFEEETAMTRNFLPTLKIDDVQNLHDFVMVELSRSDTINFDHAWSSPLGDNFVVGFILGDWHCLIDNVADFANERVDLVFSLNDFLLLDSNGESALFGAFGFFLTRVLLVSFLLRSDDLRDVVLLLLEGI